MQPNYVLDSMVGNDWMGSLDILQITISNWYYTPTPVEANQPFTYYYTVTNNSGFDQLVYGHMTNASGQVITSPDTQWTKQMVAGEVYTKSVYFSAGIPSTLSGFIQVGHIEYNLTATASPSVGGNAYIDTPGPTYYPGQTVLLHETPAVGYQFINWTVGGYVVGATQSIEIVMPPYDVTIVANFEPITACTAHTTQATCLAAGCFWWNNSCHSTAPTCTDLNNQTECTASGCYWWNNSCHYTLPQCIDYTTQSACQGAGCFWWDGSCHSSPQPACSSYTTQSTCNAAGCYWWNNSCHSTAPTCVELNNQSECTAYGCYWWNNSCHSTPQTTCSQYTSPTTCVNNGCYWWTSDNSCHNTPMPPPCSSYLNPNDCITNGCYWWNNSCHSTAPTCAELNNQSDCSYAGCYWWISDNKCHSTAEPPPCSTYNGNPTECAAHGCYYDWDTNECLKSPPIWNQPWFIPAVVVGAGSIIGVAVLLMRRKK